MSSAFSIALSSLKAQSDAINTTGNNLANMNTLGFKGSNVDFEDMISQAMGTATGTAVGMGVSAPLNNQIFTQGSIQSSTSPLATAIQGNGFFVVQNASSQQLFTRDGDFTINANGTLQTQTGETVQGWLAGPTGINTTGAPTSIVLPTGALLPPVTTKNMSLTANLDASGTVGTSTGSFSVQLQVVDSVGSEHTLAVDFTKSATANTWNYNVTIPGGDLTNGVPQTTGATTTASTSVTVASAAGIAVGQSVAGAGIPAGATVTAVNAGTGVVTLSAAATATGTGVPLTFGTTVNVLAAPGTLTFNSAGTMSASTTSPVAVTIAGLADGAGNMNINFNLLNPDGSGAITQYAEASNSASSSQDGAQAAELMQVGIQNGGQIVATFSNGQQKTEGQLALAAIQNPDSLSNVGNNNFTATGATAAPAIGMPQTGGRGEILGGSLEGSNVDMATEFTNLIVYQSAYQASSRVITTANQLSQDLMNLIH